METITQYKTGDGCLFREDQKEIAQTHELYFTFLQEILRQKDYIISNKEDRGSKEFRELDVLLDLIEQHIG